MSGPVLPKPNPVYTLDYAGWEIVDFANMTWTFYAGRDMPNRREIRRVDTNNWEVLLECGTWTDFADGFPQANEQLEYLYKEYTDKIAERELL